MKKSELAREINAALLAISSVVTVDTADIVLLRDPEQGCNWAIQSFHGHDISSRQIDEVWEVIHRLQAEYPLAATG